AGITVEGNLLRGSSGLAGEIAHIQVDPAGPVCGCGRRGCLAAVLSTTNLPAVITPTPDSPARLGDVFALAAHGLAASERILTEVSHLLGRILADVCLWLSPDIIVLDGQLGPVAPLVANTIQETIRLNAGPAFAEAVHVVVSNLQDTAELLGGLALARAELLTVGTSHGA
ncbi:MAG: ROK family protein, partial [Acidimicrobiaceae bacterium]|nr:ROK family protein [Acidimicrobiaceae bacterium]